MYMSVSVKQVELLKGETVACFRVMSRLLHVGKGKGKVLPRSGHERPEGEYWYSSTLSLTRALDEGGWSTPRPGRFTPGKETRHPLYRRLDGAPGPVWTTAENVGTEEKQ
jgi:hypothetical protein